MNEWRETTLGEVIELKRGYDLPVAQRRPGSVPIISSSGRSGLHDEAKVKGPGVVTGRSGTLGNVYYIGDDFWPLNTSLYVRDFKGNHPRFISYWLLTVPLATLDGGTANPTLNRNHAHLLRVRVPNRAVQVRVAGILGAIDDLLENNRRRIALLENMAEAIYREWFVHFRYLRHEEDEVVNTSLGPIPAGWEWTTLGTSATSYSGGTPSTKVAEYWGGDIPWITGGSLTSLLLDRSERMLTEEGVRSGSRMVPRDALMCVVRGMSLVKEFRCGIANRPLAFGQDCKAFVAKPEVEPIFLAFSIITRASDIQGMVELAGHGTGKLSTDRLEAVAFPLPPREVQRRFVSVITEIREMMGVLRRSVDALLNIRDGLLPKLVTGAIDVSKLDLDALLEESAA